MLHQLSFRFCKGIGSILWFNCSNLIRDKEANPWLNRDVLNDYKYIKNKEEVAVIRVLFVVTLANRYSASTLRPVADEHDENELPLHPKQSHTHKKYG
jgi:hypothetical protein